MNTIHHIGRDILIVLSREPLSEEALLDEMAAYHDELYYGKYASLIEDLREDDYIVRARPRLGTTVYMLTSGGRQALENRREWENSVLK